MKLCFCDRTALHLLRLWSQLNAITLSKFHHLRPGDASHLPMRSLRKATSLRQCARTEAEIAQAIASLESSPLELATKELWRQANSKQPIHVMVPDCFAIRSSDHVQLHCVPSNVVVHTFLEIAPNVLVVSPELLFVQFGHQFPLGALIALGYEMCGSYSLDDGSKLVRAPLSSLSLLKTFASKAKKIHGIYQAKRALQFVCSKSASVMESEVSALATTSVKWGGYGLPPARLNEPVTLSRRAASLARSTTIVLDAFWPDQMLALEYEGRRAHGDEHQRIRDSRRRDALNADGIEVLTITSPQFASYIEFDSLMDQVRLKLGKRKGSFPIDYLQRQGALRQEMRRFHNGVM